MENVEVIFGNVRQGAALMFYPEVNAIFTARVDNKCGIPAFKRVPVFVYAWQINLLVFRENQKKELFALMASGKVPGVNK